MKSCPVKSRTIKLLACALGLAVALVSSAGAASKKPKRTRHPQPAAADASTPCRGASQFPCGPVYFQGYYLGDDPDPFIRAMIERDLGAKFGDPN
jgi:hypothetical protein